MVFKGKHSVVQVESLVAVGFNESGIITIHENGMRNQTNYGTKEDFQNDISELVAKFKEVHKGKQIFENRFGLMLAEGIVEAGVADSSTPPDCGIYFTFKSGLREYYQYNTDVKARDEDYQRLIDILFSTVDGLKMVGGKTSKK